MQEKTEEFKKEQEKTEEFKKELEAVEKVEKEIRETKEQKFSLSAKDIHPNALYGLIAIDGPLVIDDQNNMLRTQCIYFEYEETNYLNPFQPDNFVLIKKAVDEAKRNDCRYIYVIVNMGQGYFVRAC